MTSTADYRETPYEDAAFEIVGPPPGPEEFVPLKIETMQRTQRMTDEMFQDFGGNRAETDAIWHLPKTVGYISEDKKKVEELKLQQQQDEIQQRIDAARAEGFQAGTEQATAELSLEMNEKFMTIEQHVSGILADYKKQVEETVIAIEKQAIILATQLTEKILPDAVEINPEYLIPIIQEALQLSGGAIIKQVRVSPQDLEFIQVVGLTQSLKQFDGTWAFVADETVRAGCVVETSAGVVEYDLDKAWERTKNKILSVVK
jgi:flagellar biosynthesis/type III secretory pathway protein FliH